MRKSIFTALAAGAVVLAGCAKIETTEVPESRVIGFDNFVTNAVKALDAEGDGGLTTFYVYGGPMDNTTLFAGTTVSYANGAWSYSPLKYWEASKTYNFAAYSNENGTADNADNVTLEASSNHLKIENYTSNGTEDLVYAYSHGIECTDASAALSMPSVELTFYHILSRVAFKFTKDPVSLTGTSIEVSAIQITPLNNQGTFTGSNLAGTEQYPYSTWTGQAGTETQAFENADGINLTDEAAEGQTDYEYLIPQAANGTGLTVTFTLTPTGTILNNGVSDDPKQFSVTLPATSDNQWNPGYTYVYTAEINASNFGLAPIIFDVTEIKGWSDGTINDGDILDDDITGGTN